MKYVAISFAIATDSLEPIFLFSLFPLFFQFVVRFRVVFYFDWLWHLLSTVQAPFTSCAPFIYIYSLRSLRVCEVQNRALSLHSYSRFADRLQRDSKSLFTNFIMLLLALSRTVQSGEWMKWIDFRWKETIHEWCWKETCGCANVRQIYDGDQLSTFRYRQTTVMRREQIGLVNSISKHEKSTPLQSPVKWQFREMRSLAVFYHDHLIHPKNVHKSQGKKYLP